MGAAPEVGKKCYGLLVVENGIPLRDPLFLRSEEIVGGIQDFDFFDLIALGDGIDHVLAFGHKAEDRVFSVKVRGRHVGDEKLAAIGAGACIGHGENTGAVVLESALHFIFEAVSGTAAACSGGIAALDHELLDHAVKSNVVVEATFGEVQEIRNRQGCLGGLQGCFDVAFVGGENNTDVLHGIRVRR